MTESSGSNFNAPYQRSTVLSVAFVLKTYTSTQIDLNVTKKRAWHVFQHIPADQNII